MALTLQELCWPALEKPWVVAVRPQYRSRVLRCAVEELGGGPLRRLEQQACVNRGNGLPAAPGSRGQGM